MAGVWLPILLFVVICALLIGLLPEGLRWLAVRNRCRRDELVQQIRQLERELERLNTQLAVYEGRQSEHYRALYTQMEARLVEVQGARQTMFSGGQWQFPRVLTNGWAGRHFANRPGDGLAIWQTFWRLRQCQAQVVRSKMSLDEAQSGVAALQSVPFQLQQACTAVQSHLAAIGAQLRQERAWGMRLPESLIAAHGRCQQEANQLQRLLRQPEQLPHDEAEAIDNRLTAVITETGALEKSLRLIREGREAYDVRAAEAETAGRALRELLSVAAIPDALAPLFYAIDGLQVEARRLCQERSFAQAQALLADCLRLTAFGNLLLSTTFQVDDLDELEADMLNPAPVAQVREQLSQLYRTLNDHIGDRGRGGVATAVVQSLAELTAQLRKLQTQAQEIQNEYQANARQLEREATKQTTALTRAWKAMQRVMPLAAAEPLAQRYRELREQRPATAGRPKRLAAYNSEAANLTQDLRESQAYLQERLQIMRQPVESIPTLVSEVEIQAGAWPFLQESFDQMRDKAAAIQQNWLRSLKTGWMDETHQLLDEIKLLNQQFQKIYASVGNQVEQLNRLVEEIEEIMSSLDPEKQGTAQNKVERGYKWARSARKFEEARTKLAEARNLVIELEKK